MTFEVIVFPDAAAVIIDYLEAELADRGYTLPVRSVVPNPRPDEFIRVERIGGPRLTLVSDGAQMIVEAWALRDDRAWDLAELVRALIYAMQGTVQSDTPIYRVNELAGTAYLPDPSSDQARVTFSVIVSMRGTAE